MFDASEDGDKDLIRRVVSAETHKHRGVIEDTHGNQYIFEQEGNQVFVVSGPYSPRVGLNVAQACILGKTPCRSITLSMNAMATTLYLALDELADAKQRIADLEKELESE